ncbi:hypothetical protein LZ554_007055 [Drepanopeziza brunnea f. sp. 'monogermtubi']|nr:hypothetical protein LZ554_007055 [Drepanopeziza brunnea f. sp. 'monogermtubi']
MMFTNAFAAAAILLLSPAVMAAPQTSNLPRIQLCLDRGNFGCINHLAEPGICMTLPSSHIRKVSSLNTNGLTCNLYLIPACKVEPGKEQLAFRGSSYDLAQGDYAKYNDAIASYKCN